jgi:hypothetical protein
MLQHIHITTSFFFEVMVIEPAVLAGGAGKIPFVVLRHVPAGLTL